MKKNCYVLGCIFLICLILIIPLGVYAWNFKVGIWDSHEDWAYMGSAIGGLYTPILSTFTVILLGYQAWRQNKIEKHSQDMWKIERMLSSGNKSLKIMNNIIQDIKSEHKATSASNLSDIVSAILFVHNPVHILYGSDPGYLNELKKSFFINADIYFEQLENLKINGSPYSIASYVELKNDALMVFDYELLRKCEHKGNYNNNHFLKD